MYYVIQVKTGKEQKAIEDIMKNKPDDASFDVFAPYRKSLRKFKGENREVVERCFPGYIFVETNDGKQLFKQLYLWWWYWSSYMDSIIYITCYNYWSWMVSKQ